MTQKLVNTQKKVPVLKRMAFRAGFLKNDPKEESKILSRVIPDENPELGERVVALGKSLTKKLRRDGIYGIFSEQSKDGSTSLKTVDKYGVSLQISTTDKSKTRAHFVFHMEDGNKIVETSELYISEDGRKHASVKVSEARGMWDNGQILPAETIEVYLDDVVVVREEEKPKEFKLSKIEMRAVSMEELSKLVEAIKAEHLERGVLQADSYNLDRLPNTLVEANPFNVEKIDVYDFVRTRSDMGTELVIERDETYCVMRVRFPRQIWNRAIIILQKDDESSIMFEGKPIKDGKLFDFGFSVNELADVKSFKIMFSN